MSLLQSDSPMRLTLKNFSGGKTFAKLCFEPSEANSWQLMQPTSASNVEFELVALICRLFTPCPFVISMLIHFSTYLAGRKEKKIWTNKNIWCQLLSSLWIDDIHWVSCFGKKKILVDKLPIVSGWEVRSGKHVEFGIWWDLMPFKVNEVPAPTKTIPDSLKKIDSGGGRGEWWGNKNRNVSGSEREATCWFPADPTYFNIDGRQRPWMSL